MRRALMLAFFLVVSACAKTPPPATPPVLKSVYFETGSAEIRPSEKSVIGAAGRMLNSTDWWVIVLGLTDATGDFKTNQALAQRRADVVAAELRKVAPVKPPARIKAYAIGEQLATGGSTVIERKVEFVFYKNTGQTIDQIITDSRVLTDDYQRKAASD